MILLFLALLPTILLFIYVWKKDQAEKEPMGLLVKIFFFGALSIIPAVILETIAHDVLVEILELDEASVAFIILENFIGVALIEEWGKRKAAKLAAWKHPAFNYKFDAIVYCIIAALGFATVENILYVFDNGVAVALSRALLAVPSHAIDGLVMGYFFGCAKEAEVLGDKRRRKRFYRLSLIVPTLEHGLYDASLSTESGWIMLLFFIMVISVDIWAFNFIKKQSKEDHALGQPAPDPNQPVVGVAYINNQPDGPVYNPAGATNFNQPGGDASSNL